jgi:hypothetical protein
MTEFEAMLLSVAIEAPIAFAIVAIKGWPCPGSRRGPLDAAIAISVATAVTHPQLWTAALWLYPRIGFWPAVGCAEAVVVVVEAAIILWATGLSAARAFALSTIANGASTLIGIALFG